MSRRKATVRPERPEHDEAHARLEALKDAVEEVRIPDQVDR